MNLRRLRNTHLVAAVVFLAAVLVLAVQLITPSPVMVSIGENGTDATSVGQYFTYGEVAVVVVASVLCGVSGTYLVLHDRGYGPVPRPSVDDRDRPRPRPEANGGAEVSAERTEMDADGPVVRRKRWKETLDRLENNEETVYSLLIDADGELPQRKIVEETDLSKATVSRTLDKLENGGLVVRQRNGLGNTIRLRTPRETPVKRA